MSKAGEAAAIMANQQMNCAQAVLSVFSVDLGLDKSTALKIALAFGAGMGRSGGMCGAVSGAYMVLGMRPYPGLSPAEKKEKVYSLVCEFNRRFCAVNQSTSCTDLLGYDLSTPDGLAAARSQKLFTSICPQMVFAAVTILEELS
jgi:C_GCAxxG_C_C family probable redox protein